MKIISTKLINLNLLAYLLLIRTVEPAKILCCFPVAYYSHQTVFRSVTERLADLGHELVVITPMPHDSPYENIQDIDIREVAIKWNGRLQLIADELFPMENPQDNVYAFKKINYMMAEIADDIYTLAKPLLDFESDHFDLIIIENCFTSIAGWAVKFDAPLVSLSTLSATNLAFNHIGSLTHPLLHHDWIENNVVLNTFTDKLHHIYENLVMNHQYKISNEFETAVIKKHFGNDSKSRDELQKDMDLLILNSNPMWDSLRPKAPLQIYAPTYNIHPRNDLPEDLQEYLDSSNKDVIYMSFGSEMSVSYMSRDIIEIIFRVFESIPYNIILKWNGDIPEDAPTNVRFERWLPQGDLLYHPKVKLFITHCGLHSIDEAIAAKVPMVGIPLGWDQFPNSHKIEQFGLGIKLAIHNLNYMELREAILEVIDDNSIYHQNIIEYARRVEDFQDGSLNTVVFWINYVLKHGTDHMKSPYAKTTTVEYYLLDLVGVLLILIAIILTIIILLLKAFFRKFIVKRTRSKNHFL